MMIKVIFVSVLVCAAFGHSRLDGRIVGGIEANIEDFPHQVSLQYQGWHTCGGSLITKSIVLTAAHCLQNKYPQYFKVRVGSTFNDEGGFLIGVKKILAHPLYDVIYSMDFDVGLVFLKEDVTLSTKVQIISLAEEIPADGTNATVTGWGSITSGGQITNQLYEVTLPIISNEKCDEQYPGGITEHMLCAGYDAGGKDACQGDSGGPLIVDDAQVGIVSWGRGCGEPKKAGVYANVPTLLSWILKNAND